MTHGDDAADGSVVLETLLQICVLSVQLVDELVVELRRGAHVLVGAQLAAVHEKLAQEHVARVR